MKHPGKKFAYRNINPAGNIGDMQPGNYRRHASSDDLYSATRIAARPHVTARTNRAVIKIATHHLNRAAGASLCVFRRAREFGRVFCSFDTPTSARLTIKRVRLVKHDLARWHISNNRHIWISLLCDFPFMFTDVGFWSCLLKYLLAGRTQILRGHRLIIDCSNFQ